VRGCGIENVVFNWDVFIVELINEPQGCNGLSVGSKTSFAEFLSDGLVLFRQRYTVEDGDNLRGEFGYP
jgi:hypothetical protein